MRQYFAAQHFAPKYLGTFGAEYLTFVLAEGLAASTSDAEAVASALWAARADATALTDVDGSASVLWAARTSTTGTSDANGTVWVLLGARGQAVVISASEAAALVARLRRIPHGGTALGKRRTAAAVVAPHLPGSGIAAVASGAAAVATRPLAAGMIAAEAPADAALAASTPSSTLAPSASKRSATRVVARPRAGLSKRAFRTEVSKWTSR